eukprot:75255-Alexandrium_andersonii.AAC.1
MLAPNAPGGASVGVEDGVVVDTCCSTAGSKGQARVRAAGAPTDVQLRCVSAGGMGHASN